MTSPDARTRHRLVSELFKRCLPLDGAEREAELAAAEADVRAEVESLLDLDGRAKESSLDDRVGIRLRDETGPEVERIGPYRVLRRLGAGAMGEVFLAEQTSPRREVALKVLRRAALRGPLLRRFEFEAEILARLQHDGIARIIEAGTDEADGTGRPFFAMEFVQGVPLDDFVREQRLQPAKILALIERVARAVHHAHANGIVHRDLKPANVLVTEDGDPKVLDFGVARVAAEDGGETLHTVAGQIVGTMAYMSPEQAAGDSSVVDARSDVYALGVMLHEALAGALPIQVDGQPLHSALAAIQSEIPPRLGRLDPRFVGDVETMVARALEKEPERRYPSAEALAEDIRRHLGHEPILARPQTTAYQLSRFVRRHRALVGGLTVAFVAMAVGLAVALVSLSRVETARASEKEERQRAELEAGTRDAIDRFILRDMLGAANPLSSGRDVKVVDVLAAALPRVESAFADQPQIRAGVRLTLGVSYLELGLWSEATELLEAAANDARALHGPEHPKTLEARYEYARALAADGDARALHELRELMELFRDQGEEGETQFLRTQADLATALAAEGDYAEAVAMARLSLERMVEAHGQSSEISLAGRQKLIFCLNYAGEWPEAVAEGEAYWRDAKALFGPSDPRTVRAELQLGELLSFVGRLEDALARVRSGLDEATRHFGADGGMTILGRRSLALILADGGDEQGSLAEIESVLPIANRALGESHPFTLQLRADRVVRLRRARRYEEALAEAEDVLARTLTRPASDGREMAVAENHDLIAAIHLDSQDYERAAVAMEKALSAGEKAFGEEHPRFADLLFNYGELLINQGQLDKAEANYRRLIEIDSALRGPDHPYVASETHNLARTMSLAGKNAEAIPVLERARAIHVRNGNSTERPGIATEMEIARVLSELGRHDEAIELAETQYEAMVEANRVELIDRLWMNGKLAYIYGKAGRTEDQARHEALQKAIDSKNSE